MKSFFNLNIIAVGSAIAMLMLAGCESKGVPGPQGPPGVSVQGLQGPPGPEGNPGQAGVNGDNANPIDLEDGDGTRVGPFLGFADANATTTFTSMNVNGTKVPTLVKMDGEVARMEVGFANSDCTGQAYLLSGTPPGGIKEFVIPPALRHFGFRAGNRLMRAPAPDLVEGIVPAALMDVDGNCYEVGGPNLFDGMQFLPVQDYGTPGTFRGPLKVRAG